MTFRESKARRRRRWRRRWRRREHVICLVAVFHGAMCPLADPVLQRRGCDWSHMLLANEFHPIGPFASTLFPLGIFVLMNLKCRAVDVLRTQFTAFSVCIREEGAADDCWAVHAQSCFNRNALFRSLLYSATATPLHPSMLPARG